MNFLSAFTCENQRNWLWTLGPPSLPPQGTPCKFPPPVARWLSNSRAETFELFFNAACLALEERCFEDAESWLDQAQGEVGDASAFRVKDITPALLERWAEGELN